MKKFIFLIIIFILLEFISRIIVFFYNFHTAYQNKAYYSLKYNFKDYLKDYFNFQKALVERKEDSVIIHDFYNRRYYLPNFNSSVKKFNFFTNSWGMKYRQTPVSKAAGNYRILCLGSSPTLSGSSDETTFPGILEKELRKNYSVREFEVINAAVSGSQILNSLMNFALDWRKLKPDMLIIDHNIDDIEEVLTPFYLKSYKSTNYFFTKQAYTYLKAKVGIVMLFDILSSRFFKQNKISEPPEEGLAAFETKLESLVLLSKGMGCKVVILSCGIAPERYSTQEKNQLSNFYNLYFTHFTAAGALKTIEAYNRIMHKVAERNNVIFIDMSNVVPKDSAHYKDLTHRTDLGNKVFADFLAKKLAETSF